MWCVVFGLAAAVPAAEEALQQLDGDVANYDAKVDAITEQLPGSLLESGSADAHGAKHAKHAGPDAWASFQPVEQRFTSYNDHTTSAVGRPAMAAEAAREQQAEQAEQQQLERQLRAKSVYPPSFADLNQGLSKAHTDLLQDQRHYDALSAAAGLPAPPHVLPSSFLEDGEADPAAEQAMQEDFHRRMDADHVEPPATWLEAAGFPGDTASKKAYGDLDASMQMYKKLKSAYRAQMDSSFALFDKFDAQNHEEDLKNKHQKEVDKKQPWYRPPTPSSLLETGAQPDLADSLLETGAQPDLADLGRQMNALREKMQADAVRVEAEAKKMNAEKPDDVPSSFLEWGEDHSDEVAQLQAPDPMQGALQGPAEEAQWLGKLADTQALLKADAKKFAEQAKVDRYLSAKPGSLLQEAPEKVHLLPLNPDLLKRFAALEKKVQDDHEKVVARAASEHVDLGKPSSFVETSPAEQIQQSKAAMDQIAKALRQEGRSFGREARLYPGSLLETAPSFDDTMEAKEEAIRQTAGRMRAHAAQLASSIRPSSLLQRPHAERAAERLEALAHEHEQQRLSPQDREDLLQAEKDARDADREAEQEAGQGDQAETRAVDREAEQVSRDLEKKFGPVAEEIQHDDNEMLADQRQHPLDRTEVDDHGEDADYRDVRASVRDAAPRSLLQVGEPAPVDPLEQAGADAKALVEKIDKTNDDFDAQVKTDRFKETSLLQERESKPSGYRAGNERLHRVLAALQGEGRKFQGAAAKATFLQTGHKHERPSSFLEDSGYGFGGAATEFSDLPASHWDSVDEEEYPAEWAQGETPAPTDIPGIPLYDKVELGTTYGGEALAGDDPYALPKYPDLAPPDPFADLPTPSLSLSEQLEPPASEQLPDPEFDAGTGLGDGLGFPGSGEAVGLGTPFELAPVSWLERSSNVTVGNASEHGHEDNLRKAP